MVLAYHVIFCMYGFWLPNDLRGSWSDFVGAWELLRFGTSTKTTTRRSVAGKRHDAELRRAAKAALKYPAVSLNGIQARAVARGFAEYISKSGVSVLACSILPEHVHMVLARHSFNVEYVVNQLKGYATRPLVAEGIHPLVQFGPKIPSCWARGQWKVFLDQAEDIDRAVGYMVENPIKEGLPRQTYPFVRTV